VIQDIKKRGVSYCKRKKNLMRKLIEISKLCDVNIYLVIFDKEKQTMLEYWSEKEFDLDIIKQLTSREFKQQFKYKLETNLSETKFFKPSSRDQDDDDSAAG
jgi:L-rhamnose mutarotase